MNEKTGTGVIRKHDQGWWVDPETRETYGPFNKREEARERSRMIKSREMDERPPTRLHTASQH